MSGITRALGEGANATFTNNASSQEFVITLWREKSNQIEDSDTRLRHSDTKRVALTKKQKDIVNFCSVPRTSREILERASVIYHSRNIAQYITSLVAAGYLQMTNPDNPNASNQKYRKVQNRQA